MPPFKYNGKLIVLQVMHVIFIDKLEFIFLNSSFHFSKRYIKCLLKLKPHLVH